MCGIIGAVPLRYSLTELLVQARKRSITHLLLRQLVLTAAIVLGGAVVILLAGTDALGWWWLALLAGASLAAGLYRARKLFPSPYLVAQWIDARLHLTDTISTAAFFLESPGSTDATIRESQRRQAEKLAETLDLKQALPLARPRALYPAVALAIAVAGIFLLRYAILGSFDPRTPLAQSAFDSIFRPPNQQAKAAALPDNGNQPGDGREENKESARNNDFAGDPTAESDPNFAERQKEQNSQQSGKKEQADGQEKQDSPNGDEQADKNDNKQGDPQDGNQSAKNKQDPSLLNKIREALNDMLNKMKSSPNDNSKNQKGDQQNESEQQSTPDGQAQDSSESQQAKNGKQSSDAQDGSSSAQNKPSQDQQSGIGSQEGDKAAKKAEALKAMGKITELLGKRAENVKGAVMVEVGTTRQQLKTQVTQSQAAHGEAGSEIHRDEVPPILRTIRPAVLRKNQETLARGQAGPGKGYKTMTLCVEPVTL